MSSAKLTTATSQSIQLDWTSDGKREIPLPGPRVELPDGAKLRLNLEAAQGNIAASVTLRATAQNGEEIVGRSGLAWNRGNDREVQIDRQSPNASDTPEVFKFTAKAVGEATLALVRFKLTAAALPEFFQELNTAQWTTQLKLSANGFQFPFLRGADQLVRIASPEFEPGDLETIAVKLAFQAGPLRFGSTANQELEAEVAFDPKTFALRIAHESGIQLKGPRLISPQNHLGLSWKLESTATGTGNVPLFVLATRNFHYQLQLADNARFVLEYAPATREGEPIRFVCTNFSLGEKGINPTGVCLTCSGACDQEPAPDAARSAHAGHRNSDPGSSSSATM